MTISQSSENLVTEKPVPECEEDIPEIVAEEVPQEGVQGQSAHGGSLPSIGSESALHQLKATCSSDSARMNPVHGQPSVALDKSTEDREITIRPPLLSGAEQARDGLARDRRKCIQRSSYISPLLTTVGTGRSLRRIRHRRMRRALSLQVRGNPRERNICDPSFPSRQSHARAKNFSV
jgi:hypothetical protein